MMSKKSKTPPTQRSKYRIDVRKGDEQVGKPRECVGYLMAAVGEDGNLNIDTSLHNDPWMVRQIVDWLTVNFVLQPYIRPVIQQTVFQAIQQIQKQVSDKQLHDEVKKNIEIAR